MKPRSSDLTSERDSKMFTSIRRIQMACLLVSAVCVGMASLPATALAQTVPEAKIAVLDIQKVEKTALVWMDLQKKFRAENDAMLENLRKIQAELEAEGKDLSQQQAILAPEVFATKRAEFEEKIRHTNQVAARNKQVLEQALVEARDHIVQKVREIVVTLSDEQGLNLILDRAVGDPTIILARPELEITNEVIKRLDATLQTVNFTVTPVK